MTNDHYNDVDPLKVDRSASSFTGGSQSLSKVLILELQGCGKRRPRRIPLLLRGEAVKIWHFKNHFYFSLTFSFVNVLLSCWCFRLVISVLMPDYVICCFITLYSFTGPPQEEKNITMWSVKLARESWTQMDVESQRLLLATVLK